MTRLRPRFFALCLFTTFGTLSVQAAPKITPIPIGTQAPEFELPGVDGKNHSLADYASAEVLAILFTCNHCPSAQAVEKRVIDLVEAYREKSFQLVAISPNSPAAIRINELGYSVYGDTLEDMKHHAKQRHFNFPYLYDGDDQKVTQAYGALATPHIFIFDKDRNLQYAGRVDDSRYADESLIKSHDAKNAIDALLAGNPVPVATTRPHGCTTKWAYKSDLVEKFNREFEAKTVSVETIGPEGVSKLAENKTDKLRLINLWSTMCGPCVVEMPELVEIGRQFETRGFDMITITLDDEGRLPKVQKMLQRFHAAMPRLTEASVEEEGRSTNNYLFTGSTDELAESLDERWPGPLPYTVLIAPGGEIIFRHEGEIDSAGLKTRIVDHLGRFYQPK